MIRVAGQAIAANFGINFRATRFGVLVFFQNNDACALAHNETVAVCVIGTAGRFGVIATFGRQRLTRVKARNADLGNRRFGTTGNHHVRITVFDHARRITDGMRARRTRGHNRMVRAFKSMTDRNVARDQVDQSTGNKERRHAARAFVADQVGGFGDRIQTTDTGTDHDTGALQAFLIFGVPVCIVNGHFGSRDPVKDEIINFTLFFLVHPLIRIERAVCAIAVFDFAGISGGQMACIEFGDGTRAGLTVQQAFPCCFDPTGQRCDKTQSGYYDATHDCCPHDMNFVDLLLPCQGRGEQV